MKEFTLISSQWGRCGYKDDDWQIIRRIKSENDLYEALKEGYLEDARHRNNYPVRSHEISRIFTRMELKEEGLYELGYNEEDDDYYIFDYRYEKNDNVLKTEVTFLYQNALIKFEKWKNKIQSLVPRLQENKRKIDKEIAERNKLAELAEKYDYELIKKEKILLAEFSVSSYSSAGSTSEKMIVSEEEAELIKNSNVKINISLPSGYYTCGGDGDYDLSSKDISIRNIDKATRRYLSSDWQLEEDGHIKDFINKTKEAK